MPLGIFHRLVQRGTVAVFLAVIGADRIDAAIYQVFINSVHPKMPTY